MTPQRARRRPNGTGSVRRRGRGFWIRYRHHGKRIDENAHTSDRAKAAQLLKERLRKAGTPEFTPPRTEKVTVRQCLDLYRHHHEQNRTRSRSDAERLARQLDDEFGHVPVAALSPTLIEEFKTRRLVEARPGTINRQLAALRRSLRLAVQRRLIPAATVPVITLLDERDGVRTGYAEPAEFNAICKHLPDDVCDVARFAYLTCWRRSMVLGLQWSHVQLDRAEGEIVGGVIRLPGTLTKNRTPVTVVLRGKLLDLIRARHEKRVLACSAVFHRNGRPILDFYASWQTACTQAGMKLAFHDLRRSAARNLRRAGVSESVIMAMGGWKTRSVFHRYDIISEDDLADAAEKMTAFLAGKADSKVTPIHAARRVLETRD